MTKRSVQLHVRLLGAPEFSWAGQPLAALRRSRTTSRLLAYLVVHSEQAHSRDKLATLFWPNLTAARARRNLNNVLWELRRALPSTPGGGDYLIADSQTFRFNHQAPYRLDVEEFERGIRDFLYAANPTIASLQAAEAALELYRGDFMREFDDEWCETLRLALRESYLLALEKLITTYRTQNRTDKALHAAHRLVREDPFREAGHYQLVSLLIHLYRYPEARQSYEHYAALWQQELKVEPSAQMQKLAGELDPHFSLLGVMWQVLCKRAGRLRWRAC